MVYMLLVRKADLLSTFNIVWDISHGFIRNMPKSTMNYLIIWVPYNKAHRIRNIVLNDICSHNLDAPPAPIPFLPTPIYPRLSTPLIPSNLPTHSESLSSSPPVTL